MAVKLSERTHPDYDENIDNWNFYSQSAKGGKDYLNEDNLYTHRLEDTEDYDERVDRLYFLNFCDIIPTIYNNFIFKTSVGRKNDEILDVFRRDVDGKGTDIDEFVKLAGYWSSVYGIMHAVVSIPDTGGIVTKFDEKERNIRAYAKLIHPTDVIDWSVDRNGNYNWIILKYRYLKDLDPTIDREEEDHYMLITKDNWEIQNEDGEVVKFEDGSKSKGSNKLGYIPIVSIYNKNTSDDKVGESLLKDIVYVNRTIFNWCSCIDEQIERQTFSQLVTPDDGSLAEQDETGDDPLYRIGTSSIWTFPHESKNPPQFISPDVANISTIWDLIIDHAREIFRMSGLQGTSSDVYTSKSGRAGQFSFLGVNSALATKAKMYQKFENDLSKMVYMVSKDNQPEEFGYVKYPDDFDVSAIEDEVDTILKLMERNFSKKLNKVLQKQLARKSVTLETDQIRKEIETEIDEGDGTVLPINKSANESPRFDDGSGNPNTNMNESFKSKDKADEENIGHRKRDK